MLLVDAALPSAASSQTVFGRRIFFGQETGFTISWHYSIGAAFVLTMAVNSVSPHLYSLLLLICRPRFRESKVNPRAMTQAELNAATTPPLFELPTRVSIMLNIVFCCIMYSPGHPILLGIALISFMVFYMIDKCALLRVYMRPPLYDETLFRFAANLMPWAGILHFAVAVWMYSDTSVLYSPNLFGYQESSLFIGNSAGATLDSFAMSAQASDKSGINVIARISQVWQIFNFLKI